MASWIAWTLEAQVCKKTRGVGAGDMALLGFFSSLWQLVLKELPWLVLVYCSVHQALKGHLF